MSIAGLITGVAATNAPAPTILTAGFAGTVAGAVSMAAGEYVSVAAQRDSEHRLVAQGGMWADEMARPWQAAATSCVAFLAGAVLPLLAVLASTASWRVPVIAAAVVLALTGTGITSARLADTAAARPTVRTVAGGVLALAVTYLLGRLTGATGL